MPSINAQGMLVDARVHHRRFAVIEHGPLSRPKAIVVHQTDSSNTASTLSAYAQQATGAHFLIGKDGQIYQTASLNKQCYHVGKLIKSKCLTLNIVGCRTPQMVKALAISGIERFKAIDAIERGKGYPDRYPVNADSVGIELVGRHLDDATYEPVTGAQAMSLQWLIDALYANLGLGASDVFRHPEVSYRNPGEARSATWR